MLGEWVYMWQVGIMWGEWVRTGWHICGASWPTYGAS